MTVNISEWIEVKFIPEFNKDMYVKYTPVTSDREVVGDGYQEFVWWKVTVSETVSGAFEDFTWIPFGVPMRGLT